MTAFTVDPEALVGDAKAWAGWRETLESVSRTPGTLPDLRAFSEIGSGIELAESYRELSNAFRIYLREGGVVFGGIQRTLLENARDYLVSDDIDNQTLLAVVLEGLEES